jgi:hypothetical protein
MQHCATCSEEFAAFGDVRGAIGEWRQQALGPLTSTAFEANAVQVSAATSERRRSALAALREFFAISPAWMRAATAVAAVAFCALAAIAVAHFIQKPQTLIVEKIVKSGYSDEEVQKMVAEAMKRQNESQLKDAPVVSPESTAVNEQLKVSAQTKRNASGTPQMANNNRKQQPASRNRARPSTELASTDYLPFTASRDDEKLPSLADLVDDAN